LPAPGGDEELCALVARIMGQRLDRDRPLWEYWLVEGLADGRWAVLAKVHLWGVIGGLALFDLVLVGLFWWTRARQFRTGADVLQAMSIDARLAPAAGGR